ncbi:MAG: mechanosensitive ion channel family protein [Acidobacteriota bacterium]
MARAKGERITGARALLGGLVLFSALAISIRPTLGQPASSAPPSPSVSSDLTDPEITSRELAYRLVPLTKVELTPLADSWLEIVRAKTEEIAERQVARLEDPSSVSAETNRVLARTVEERAALFERFSRVVDALEAKGGDEAVVRELRAYRDSVLLSETLLANPKAIAIAITTWLTRADGGLAIARNLGLMALFFLALVFVSRSIRGLVRRWLGRVPDLSKLLQSLLVNTAYWLVLTIGLLFALAALGVNVAPLFAMIGGASFILAFALQDTLGNFASGLMIIVNRPFDEGDYVVVDGTGGTVQSVSIVATTVTTPDNQVIVIPNKNVWGNVITNVTASDTRRVDLVFGISYEDSIPDALRVIEETVKSHSLVLDDPEPVVRVHELADSSVNFVCRPWARTEDYWTVYWDLTHRMKEALEDASITLPYPQRDVHIRAGSALGNS